jgi:ATP-binding cassette, subfamily B, multidrug efflux pump
MNQLIIKSGKIYYKDDERVILNISSLSISTGINFIIGDNGTGKSTFLKSLANQFPEIVFDGELFLNERKFDKRIVGLVNQSPIKSISQELTFLDNLLFAKFGKSDFIKLSRIRNTMSINNVFEFLDYFAIRERIKNLINVESSKLSAGQQQLLAILMRLLRFNKVLLLDEATANLDMINTKIIISILSEIVKKGTIVLFATHQMGLIEMVDCKVFSTNSGEILEK